ncbi:hypothetical protein O5O45_11275 [Hahella aquimaris]|uniref:hypothetical protein n=1 Tax=Hahella sp. HNIBRBA332 TaxID=3015983 RepID=UPI00273AA046|nr:hypothetical protein [Hahella sp. HNIBRBA332]WLQ16501.1 hypothetical protein O5O45_11275 [Hahella sp. HNIBRBA332]
MLVSKDLFPIDEKDWHSFLRDYFCDKDAIPTIENDKVRLRLEWPSDVDRHVDPNLQENLQWLGKELTLSSMWSFRKRNGRIFTVLYDTWTLLSWSEWLSRTPSNKHKNIVILHADDHRDLGSPRIVTKDGVLLDAITGESINIYDPHTVQKAIESGAIGMGSFMTPFICEIPSTQVRHLCQPPKLSGNSKIQMNSSDRELDKLLHYGASRMSLELVNDDHKWNYLATSDPSMWINDISDKTVLVHIDMDYFNNRYDGDSEWRVRPSRLDPDTRVMNGKIDELIETLSSIKLKIEDVTIAFSPGFFPAEYWRDAYQRLQVGLEKVLCV